MTVQIDESTWAFNRVLCSCILHDFLKDKIYVSHFTSISLGHKFACAYSVSLCYQCWRFCEIWDLIWMDDSLLDFLVKLSPKITFSLFKSFCLGIFWGEKLEKPYNVSLLNCSVCISGPTCDKANFQEGHFAIRSQLKTGKLNGEYYWYSLDMWQPAPMRLLLSDYLV